MRRRLISGFRPALILACVCAVLASPAAHAHPIEYHMQPLEDADVERVLSSLELITDELEAAGALSGLRVPDDALGITAILWALLDAVLETDQVSRVDSPTLMRSLAGAGYPQSYYVVEQWQGEAERVIETYEVLKRGLDMKAIYRGYAELEARRGELSAKEADRREGRLVRDHQMVRTTYKDLSLISAYLPRLDALAARLGLEAGRD
jgi:hypothetical protein